tara:strand:- start:147 stop:752 length:606 start_codon:yes stop_codon:yes gene_type:complete
MDVLVGSRHDDAYYPYNARRPPENGGGGVYTNDTVFSLERSGDCLFCRREEIMDIKKLTSDLHRDEGVVYEIYLDTADPPLKTAGCGHMIRQSEPEFKLEVGTKIPKERVDAWFGDDLDTVLREIKVLYVNFDQLKEPAQRGLANMLFNLGFRRLSKFKKLKKAVLAQDYKQMAIEARDSKWFRQVKGRAERICDQFESCA